MFTGGGVLRNRCFNPRTREGCDGCLFGLHQLTKVSIHAPVRGATCRCWARPSAWGCFNPRTREGCDLPSLVVPNVSQVVSIHAPVRGATLLPCCSCTFSTVSIHAPVRGATMSNWEGVATSESFNPRTREGCDFSRSWSARRDLFQSTHP